MNNHEVLIRTAIFLSFFSHVVAQNWSPINTEETFYYNSGSEELTGIRVDSTAVVEGDTVWYTNLLVDFHPELEVNPISCSGFDAEAAIMDAGFMQFEIIPEGAGVYTFQNPDTFEIHTQATVGSEWVYSQLYGEEEVSATVTDVISTGVLSQLDSVKFISLSDGRNIVLSKNHGLIEFESVNGNTYGISGIADRQLGIYPIGRHEIYDFSPGDVFVYLGSGGYSEEYYKTLMRVEVEEVNEAQDGLEIQFSRAIYRRIWVMTPSSPVHVEIDPQISNASGLSYSFSMTDRQLSDVIPNTAFNQSNSGAESPPFFWGFPEGSPTFNRFVNSGEINERMIKAIGGTPALSESYILAAEEFEELSAIPFIESDAIYQNLLDSSCSIWNHAPFLLSDTAVFTQCSISCLIPYEYFAYGEGLGVISYQNNNGLSGDEQVLVGYRKGDEEFGYIPTASEILSVGDELAGALPTVTVYPVPAVDQLYFSRTDAQTYRIFDIAGKPVLQGALLGVSGIDVSNLAAGMYNGHLLRDDQPTGQFRFVKR